MSSDLNLVIVAAADEERLGHVKAHAPYLWSESSAKVRLDMLPLLDTGFSRVFPKKKPKHGQRFNVSAKFCAQKQNSCMVGFDKLPAS